MSYLQFLVDIERLLEMMTFLVEFSLDVEKGLIVWAEGKTLAYELLEIGIILVVDTQIYCRRNDVIVGRIVIRCLFESDDGKLIFIGFCASLYEVDEYRFTVLLVTRTEISLQVWNSFFILAAVYQIGCRKVRCFISFDFFILSFLFLCKGRKKKPISVGSFWFNLVQTHFFEFTPYYIGECLPQFPSLFSYEMRKPTPFNVRFHN